MSSSECAFSVVIPTCNRPVQLGLCLRALAAQDYPKNSFEIIVVDDGGSAGDRPGRPLSAHAHAVGLG